MAELKKAEGIIPSILTHSILQSQALEFKIKRRVPDRFRRTTGTPDHAGEMIFGR